MQGGTYFGHDKQGVGYSYGVTFTGRRRIGPYSLPSTSSLLATSLYGQKLPHGRNNAATANCCLMKAVVRNEILLPESDETVGG